MPPSLYPETEARDYDPPHVVMLGSFLGVVLADWCVRYKLAPNLVASASDLKSLVRSHVEREPLPDIPLAQGWRAAAVLPELQAILDGTRAVRVENVRAMAPLEFLPVVETDDPGAEDEPTGLPRGDKL